MKAIIILFFSSLLCVAAQASAGSIEVVLSAQIQEKVDRIDRIEKDREKDFRKNRYYDLHVGLSSEYANKSRFAKTKWANEELIPKLDDYGLENLLQAMLKENLSRIVADNFDDTIRVTLDHISVSNHSLAVISGGSYIKGRIEQIDNTSGEVIKSFDITSNVSTGFTASNSYDGPGFAFHEIDETTRIGPSLASFVRHSLGKLFPDEKEKLAKPISVMIGAASGIRSNHSAHLLKVNDPYRRDFYSQHYR